MNNNNGYLVLDKVTIVQLSIGTTTEPEGKQQGDAGLNRLAEPHGGRATACAGVIYPFYRANRTRSHRITVHAV